MKRILLIRIININIKEMIFIDKSVLVVRTWYKMKKKIKITSKHKNNKFHLMKPMKKSCK